MPPAEHLFITLEGTATSKGATLGDDHQLPEAGSRQAFWVRATPNSDIAIDPDFRWAAIQYTIECTDGVPKTKDWQTQWTAAMNRLSDVTLDATLTPQTMDSTKRATQAHHSIAKHTVWHYPTTIHPETIS